MLCVVMIVVVLFENSSNLASAYGIAVTGTMIVTTIGLSIVMVRKWQWPSVAIIVTLGFFLMVGLGKDLGKSSSEIKRASSCFERSWIESS